MPKLNEWVIVRKVYRCDPDKNINCPKYDAYCYRKYSHGCKYMENKKYRMNIFKRFKEWLVDKISRLYWGKNCRYCGYYVKESNKCFVHGKCKKNCVIS